MIGYALKLEDKFIHYSVVEEFVVVALADFPVVYEESPLEYFMELLTSDFCVIVGESDNPRNFVSLLRKETRVVEIELIERLVQR